MQYNSRILPYMYYAIPYVTFLVKTHQAKSKGNKGKYAQGSTIQYITILYSWKFNRQIVGCIFVMVDGWCEQV